MQRRWSMIETSTEEFLEQIRSQSLHETSSAQRQDESQIMEVVMESNLDADDSSKASAKYSETSRVKGVVPQEEREVIRLIDRETEIYSLRSSVSLDGQTERKEESHTDSIDQNAGAGDHQEKESQAVKKLLPNDVSSEDITTDQVGGESRASIGDEPISNDDVVEEGIVDQSVTSQCIKRDKAKQYEEPESYLDGSTEKTAREVVQNTIEKSMDSSNDHVKSRQAATVKDSAKEVRNHLEDDIDQPDLVPSTTEDSEEYNPITKHMVDTTKTTNSGHVNAVRNMLSKNQTNGFGLGDHIHREAIAYLLRYETMVLQQEGEEVSTLTYMRPLLERLHLLGNKGRTEMGSAAAFNDNNADEVFYSDLCNKTISYRGLKQALDVLENETSSEGSTELLVRDRQLMMILRMLTQKLASSDEETLCEDTTITWAELVHCYRVCIVGMLTLKNLPKGSSVRHVTKDRILSQLSLFELPATKLLKADNDDVDALGLEEQVAIDRIYPARKNAKSFSLRMILVAIFVAVVLGFVSGLSCTANSILRHPQNEDFGQVETLLEDVNQSVTQSRQQEDLCESQASTCPVPVNNFTNLTSWSHDFVRARQGLPTKILRPGETLLELQSLSTAALLHLASSLKSTTSIPVDTTTESSQPEMSKPNTKSFWKSVAPGQQLAISAMLGAIGGPRIWILAGAAAKALSLSNLSIVPASLVVVGAIAVAVHVFKGVRFVVQRFFLKA